jgi:septal ring factor EnvC (AmiA/AmiB activator)
MMRRLASLALLAAPILLAAASAPVIPAGETADAALARAQSEAAAAAKRLSTLEAAAAKAGNEAARLRTEQAAAAAAIDEAEAKISESEASLHLAQAKVALVEQRLASRRAPLAALLAGLATMGRQPPLLALADRGSVEEMVRVKALLDTTMPVIEQRSAALRGELAERRQLASAADAARAALAKNRDELAQRQQQFAELEDKAAKRASELAGEAFGAGDRVLASGEELEAAGNEAAARQSSRATAAALASLEFAPARPMPGDSALPATDFAYSLPVSARLVDGLGSVNRAGIVSRGLRFDTSRGANVIVPADGKILFAAPYRGEDGLVIIDHGKGWTTLLLGVASDKPRGTEVRRGEFLGRALGPIGVELRRNGRPISPAFIAASSVPLLNSGNSR